MTENRLSFNVGVENRLSFNVGVENFHPLQQHNELNQHEFQNLSLQNTSSPLVGVENRSSFNVGAENFLPLHQPNELNQHEFENLPQHNTSSPLVGVENRSSFNVGVENFHPLQQHNELNQHEFQNLSLQNTSSPLVGVENRLSFNVGAENFLPLQQHNELNQHEFQNLSLQNTSSSVGVENRSSFNVGVENFLSLQQHNELNQHEFENLPQHNTSSSSVGVENFQPLHQHIIIGRGRKFSVPTTTQQIKMTNTPTYNPQIHHRRSIRLKGYDYSQAGMYFVTICCKDRECRFGRIENDEMILNDAGKNANECWLEIPNHFPNAILHEHIVMPNHVHGIIELLDVANVGVENRSSFNVGAENFLPQQNTSPLVGVENFLSLQQHNELKQHEFQKMIPRSIGSIVKGFKIGVTKWFRNNSVGVNNDLPLQIWQRNYYEHIIRNEQSYQKISEYIINNPSLWKEDKFYK